MMMLRNRAIRSIVLIALLLSVVAPVRYTQAQETATLTVLPETAPQNSTVTITLEGFQPEEPVTIWMTLPNYATEQVGDYTIDETGGFTLEYLMAASRPRGQYAFTARGNWSNRRASDLFELTLGEGVPADSDVTLALESSEVLAQGDELVFVGNGFQARERVSIWINLPTDTIEDVGAAITERDGTFRYTLSLDSNYPEGRYQITAFGNESNLTAITDFVLQRGQLPSFDLPVLFINPSQVRQFERIRIEGQNFAGEETVSVWMTLNDGVVVQMRETTTDADGNFAFEVVLDASRYPVGRHQVTAFGRASLLVAVGLVEVQPGEGPEE
ncbi:MAG: hypothetical protein HC876_11060 [Chloroflexaceae bacterium]|nr:hypothetical protein [Chloroflexaceae bacterium]